MFEKNSSLINLLILHLVILSINLVSLPLFTTLFILFAYLDYITSKEQENDTQNQPEAPARPDAKKSSFRTFKYHLMFSFLVICCLGIAAMMRFQIYAITNERKIQKFYMIPCIILWFMVLINLIILARMIIVEDKEKGYKICLLKFTIYGIGTITMQLVSWHLVFVLYGLILNPLRAFLYSVAIIIAVLWCIIFLVLLSMIFRISNILGKLMGKILEYILWAIYSCIELPGIKHCIFCLRVSFCYSLTGHHQKKDRVKTIVLLFSLMALLTFIGAFTVFILHINISSGHPTLDELTKSLIPKIFLVLIVWLLLNIFFHSNKDGKFLKLYTDFKEMWSFMDFYDKKE